MRDRHARKNLRPILILAILSVVLSITVNDARATNSFQRGDIFVSIGNGQVEWVRPGSGGSFTLEAILHTVNFGTGFFANSGMAFDSTGNLYATDFEGNAVSKFSPYGVLLGAFGYGYNCKPESITLDMSGKLYVGQADCSTQILKFSSSGSLLASYSPCTRVNTATCMPGTSQNRGTDWIDLAVDQCTIFYTSESHSLLSFNACTRTQNPDITDSLPSVAYAHRVLADGTHLIADTDRVVRLDSAGKIIQTYLASTFPGFTQTPIFPLNVDLDGTSFWTADCFNVWKIDINTGSKLAHFNAFADFGIPMTGLGSEFLGIGGVEILGEIVQGAGHPTLSISESFTDSSLIPLALDNRSNPSVGVVLARGTVRSATPGRILAWINVTNNSASSIESIKLNDTLPIDWAISPTWMPPMGAVGAIHVFYANTTSLSTDPEITQLSTITVFTGNPETVYVAISNLTATAVGHPLMPGQSILLSVKLTYGLVDTSQSPSSYPRNYTDTATAAAWTQPSFIGSKFTGTASAFFTADAKVVS